MHALHFGLCFTWDETLGDPYLVYHAHGGYRLQQRPGLFPCWKRPGSGSVCIVKVRKHLLEYLDGRMVSSANEEVYFKWRSVEPRVVTNVIHSLSIIFTSWYWKQHCQCTRTKSLRRLNHIRQNHRNTISVGKMHAKKKRLLMPFAFGVYHGKVCLTDIVFNTT